MFLLSSRLLFAFLPSVLFFFLHPLLTPVCIWKSGTDVRIRLFLFFFYSCHTQHDTPDRRTCRMLRQREIRLLRSTPAGLKVGAWPISCVLYYPIFSADLWLSHSVLSSELFITAGNKKREEKREENRGFITHRQSWSVYTADRPLLGRQHHSFLSLSHSHTALIFSCRGNKVSSCGASLNRTRWATLWDSPSNRIKINEINTMVSRLLMIQFLEKKEKKKKVWHFAA